MRINLGQDVFKIGFNRLYELFNNGHRVVVSFSAGKDSGVCLELALAAAEKAGRLPIDVVMRDEEIMFPGTFEYAERVAKMKGVNFHWYVANQPIINIFNRGLPYFWTFDPILSPEDWVRKPPSFAEKMPHLNIEKLITRENFPTEDGKDLVSVIGLRVEESPRRRMAIASSKGFLTAIDKNGVRKARPIYDWTTGDVWKAVKDNSWDYNHAYTTLYQMGAKSHQQRIAPPTLSSAGIEGLQIAAKAHPKWFDKVCERLPGVRTATMFGRHAVEPMRASGETWEQTYQREDIDTAPKWIADRAIMARERALAQHKTHSNLPYPQVDGCKRCHNYGGSWKKLAKALYMGDPFSIKIGNLPYVEPEFFRVGAGVWGGKPTW